MLRAKRAAGAALLSVMLAGCLPDVQDPAVFVEETLPLRDEWLDICAVECTLEDASPACGPFPGDPISCGLFDPKAALECYLAYDRAVGLEQCTNKSRSVKTIEENCGDVYGDCAEPGVDTDADTDGTEG